MPKTIELLPKTYKYTIGINNNKNNNKNNIEKNVNNNEENKQIEGNISTFK